MWWEGIYIGPCFLYHGNSWRGGVSLMPLPLYPGGKSHWHPFLGGAVDPIGYLDDMEK
jgi:hypothetical protein